MGIFDKFKPKNLIQQVSSADSQMGSRKMKSLNKDLLEADSKNKTVENNISIPQNNKGTNETNMFSSIKNSLSQKFSFGSNLSEEKEEETEKWKELRKNRLKERIQEATQANPNHADEKQKEENSLDTTKEDNAETSVPVVSLEVNKEKTKENKENIPENPIQDNNINELKTEDIVSEEEKISLGIVDENNTDNSDDNSNKKEDDDSLQNENQQLFPDDINELYSGFDENALAFGIKHEGTRVEKTFHNNSSNPKFPEPTAILNSKKEESNSKTPATFVPQENIISDNSSSKTYQSSEESLNENPDSILFVNGEQMNPETFRRTIIRLKKVYSIKTVYIFVNEENYKKASSSYKAESDEGALNIVSCISNYPALETILGMTAMEEAMKQKDMIFTFVSKDNIFMPVIQFLSERKKNVLLVTDKKAQFDSLQTTCLRKMEKYITAGTFKKREIPMDKKTVFYTLSSYDKFIIPEKYNMYFKEEDYIGELLKVKFQHFMYIVPFFNGMDYNVFCEILSDLVSISLANEIDETFLAEYGLVWNKEDNTIIISDEKKYKLFTIFQKRKDYHIDEMIIRTCDLDIINQFYFVEYKEKSKNRIQTMFWKIYTHGQEKFLEIPFFKGMRIHVFANLINTLLDENEQLTTSEIKKDLEKNLMRIENGKLYIMDT